MKQRIVLHAAEASDEVNFLQYARHRNEMRVGEVSG